VFISYAHENPAHRQQVIQFATVLRTELGIDAKLNVWFENERRDWTQWALQQLAEADFVMAIASPAFRERIDGQGDPTVERDVWFQGGVLRNLITEDQQKWIRRILPVVLPGNTISDIPQVLFPYSATHYVIEEFTADGLRKLSAALVGDGAPIEPALGTYVAPEPIPDTTPLTELRAAHRGSDIRFRAAELNGKHYGASIVYRPDLFCNEPRGAVEYTIGRRFRRFYAIAGVLDDARDAGQTGHFELFVDGKLRARAATTLGKPARFTVDVTGVLRLRLVAYRSDTVANPMMIGALMTSGKSGNMPELAWGDPTLSG
jgi:hypothetical protein